MVSDEQRFAELLSLALDNACSDAERDELAQLAAKHPQLIVESVGEIFTHTLLEWQSEDISECMKLELAASAHDQLKVPRATTALRPTRRLLWRFAAAILLIAIGFGSWQIAGIRLRNSPIAEIIAQDDLTWTSNSTALRDGNLIVPGRLENRTGSFTLKFRSGPIVRIAGQTSLDIKSALLVHLERGQATARVPESGKGFAIKTQEAKVVDQGTEFGVFARDDGVTDVIVFEGRVDLHETAGAVLPPRSLTIGDAARINSIGAVDRIMEVGRDTSGGWWTTRPSSARLIASVKDNIVSDVSDMFTCYQTTYGGLHDDALAYADNAYHQWNGLSDEGLPEFLRGADYIKTFNDYRYRQDFELTLEIAKPTNLYVFADNRIPPPEWLKSQFEDTGVDIGLDEGPWQRKFPNSIGNSIRTLRPSVVAKASTILFPSGVAAASSPDRSFSVTPASGPAKASKGGLCTALPPRRLKASRRQCEFHPSNTLKQSTAYQPTHCGADLQPKKWRWFAPPVGRPNACRPPAFIFCIPITMIVSAQIEMPMADSWIKASCSDSPSNNSNCSVCRMYWSAHLPAVFGASRDLRTRSSSSSI